jgi:hypothetical protein
MKKLMMIGGSGVLGLCLGLVMSAQGVKAQTLALAGLLAVPPVAVGLIVGDTKAQERINKAESKASDALRSLDGMSIKLTGCEEREARLKVELAEMQGTFTRFKELLKACESDRCQSAESISQLQGELANLRSALAQRNERLEELEAEVEEWERTFHTKLDAEAEKRFQVAKLAEIRKIEAENDEITREAMDIVRGFRQWAVEVDGRLQDRGEFIKSVTGQYNAHLDGLKTSVSTQVDEYLKQIEILNVKVAMLQQKLQGDLIEPEYGQFGFDQNGRIANAIAEYLWNHHKIPLKVTGFEVNDGVITAGFTYSRSMAPESLARVIEGESSRITRSLGLYALEKPQKLQIADVFTVRVRRDRPARKTDKGSLYRSREELVGFILSQPVRLRVIGEPGAGKTPSVAVLLSYILKRGFLNANTPNGQKLPYCVVESCNPLAGISVKNGDELDFCLRWNDGKKGFKGLVEEYKFRKNPSNAEYKNQVGYIWVADEIDNTMAELTKDEAKPFKDALKDGGHVNIGVIVMGQSANVSTSKGLSIDDQKMMTNIYIDPVSIRTFLTQYGERFYSKKAVEKALATLEELELEIEEQNEIICDTAREFRIGMVTANRSPVFYQLPYFDSVEINSESYQQTLRKVSVIRDGRGETPQDASVTTHLRNPDLASVSRERDTSGHSPMSGLGTCPDTSVKPTCPHCGSSAIRSKGSKWLCQNPEHSSVAPDKPKSWNK